MPAETLLPATARWIGSLPVEFQPKTISEAFPRIANVLAALWTRRDALDYLNELLVDKRRGRQGFPMKVSGELHALRAYCATLDQARSDATDSIFSLRDE